VRDPDGRVGRRLRTVRHDEETERGLVKPKLTRPLAGVCQE
jgi:hypothetical protein